jgi:hypothetical protein
MREGTPHDAKTFPQKRLKPTIGSRGISRRDDAGNYDRRQKKRNKKAAENIRF